jgi:hypothetical protein
MRKSNLILCSSLKNTWQNIKCGSIGKVLDGTASSLQHSLSSMQFGQKTATAYIASFFLFPGNHRRFS